MGRAMETDNKKFTNLQNQNDILNVKQIEFTHDECVIIGLTTKSDLKMEQIS